MDARYLQHISVLYVEDDPAIREGLSRFLRRRVGSLYLGENGQEGLEAFKTNRPDLIVTDIRMPVMDGLTMAEKIRELDREIPIVITTAFNDEEYFLKAIDIGIDKYIKKPINNKEFMDVLGKVARVVSQQKELDEKNELIKIILDNSPHHMMILDGETPVYFNKSLLDYVGCESVEEFLEVHENMNKFLVTKEESFYKDKTFCQWVCEVRDHPEEEYIVYMHKESELKSEAGAYAVDVNPVPESNKYLVSFSDITKIEEQRRIYHEMAIKDPLTGIFNRQKFGEALEDEVERAARYHQHLALIMFDIDRFKNVNDTYGHQAGDYILQGVVNTVQQHIRKLDIFARYGGEEFVVLAPETTLEGAGALAEKLREIIADSEFQYVGKLTCSFGVSGYRDGEKPDQFIKRADDALYAAKNAGRNRVEMVAEPS